MKLITKELEKRFEEVGNQARKKDPIVIARFFNASGQGVWLATEYDPEQKIFFGYVSIFGDWNDEWGSFGLQMFTEYNENHPLGIERDMYFKEKPISEVMPKAIKK